MNGYRGFFVNSIPMTRCTLIFIDMVAVLAKLVLSHALPMSVVQLDVQNIWIKNRPRPSQQLWFPLACGAPGAAGLVTQNLDEKQDAPAMCSLSAMQATFSPNQTKSSFFS